MTSTLRELKDKLYKDFDAVRSTADLCSSPTVIFAARLAEAQIAADIIAIEQDKGSQSPKEDTTPKGEAAKSPPPTRFGKTEKVSQKQTKRPGITIDLPHAEVVPKGDWSKPSGCPIIK